MSGAVGAVDLGTNSVRLLVLRDGDELVRRTTITRLGAGVDATGRLAPEAVERTLAELAACRALLDQHRVERLRVVATSAARDAANREAFFAAVVDTLGRPVELVSGADEARLSFAGATSWLPADRGPFLVVDIGGGSTEFAVGLDEPTAVLSVDMGSVRITEGWLASDPPAPEELANALGVVADHLDDVLREVPGVGSAPTMVGVAGTITTIAAVELGQYRRDLVHGFVLTRDAVEDVFRTLATETLADRRHNPGLDPARADIIVGGCCILAGILRRLGRRELVVSECDLLDAAAASLDRTS